MNRTKVISSLLLVLVVAGGTLDGSQDTQTEQEGFRFRTGVELVNVTATVTDSRGRFVAGLRREDFRLFEDDQTREITHFSNERVPVSLGILLDTSGSMAGEKMAAARSAVDRFLVQLLHPEDEVFLFTFNDEPRLVSDWTTDRREVSRLLGRVRAGGGTAMYDALTEAVPMAQSGRHRKKAVVVISDGNDTDSRTDVGDLRRLIRETEVLVYAVGIDGDAPDIFTRGRGMPPPRFPVPLPFPFPGGGGRNRFPQPGGGGPLPRGGPTPRDYRVNERALREITDDSGGRTELVRDAPDIDPATAGIAEELSQQYYLGYPAGAARDGRWHTIRVEVRDASYKVRARRGYIAGR